DESLRTVERKISPATVGELAVILDRGFNRDHLSLRVPAVVDRHVRVGAPDLENEHRLVGPDAGADELPVRLARDEDVVEQWRPPGRGLRRPIRHPKAARDVNPFAIFCGPNEPAAARVSGTLGRTRL